jgi:TonB family protein
LLPADPAPMSESESDPFSRTGFVIIRPGKMEVQLGRRVKPIRPVFNLKNSVDMFTMAGVIVGARVSLDAAGNVTDVKILRPSGSPDVDLAVENALYKWWIEPGKDRNGQAHADAVYLELKSY